MTIDGLSSLMSANSSQIRTLTSSRTYGYPKLSDPISALPLLDVVQHPRREGKQRGIYVLYGIRVGGARTLPFNLNEDPTLSGPAGF